MFSALKLSEKFQLSSIIFNTLKRNGHTLRGKPPGIARSLQQRLADENPIEPELAKKINIGFPKLRASRSAELRTRLDHLKKLRSNPEIEKKAKSKELLIDLEEVEKDWLATNGPHHIVSIANFYKIFEHLFGAAYFVPRVNLDIRFSKDDVEIPVYFGNLLKPSEAAQAPTVTFDPTFSMNNEKVDGSKTLWTLLLTNPDGHFEKSDGEYVHWLISNIPGNDVAKGDQLVPYLQPFPPKGIGFQRHVFILFKQNKKIDLSGYKVDQPFVLNQRTFNTYDFYRKLQDDITPAGLAFFQADYDQSLTDFYHNKLNMKEPIYEYDFPKKYIRDQTWFPMRQPFNLYMDNHRDQKQVAKEYVERELAKTHPFDGPEPELKFKNAHSLKDIPSWWKTEKKKDRLGWGRINQFKYDRQ